MNRKFQTDFFYFGSYSETFRIWMSNLRSDEMFEFKWYFPARKTNFSDPKSIVLMRKIRKPFMAYRKINQQYLIVSLLDILIALCVCQANYTSFEFQTIEFSFLMSISISIFFEFVAISYVISFQFKCFKTEIHLSM